MQEIPLTILLFGVTGDLSRRKLLPGLYRLLKDKKITQCSLIGIGLEQKNILDVLREVKTTIADVDELVWQQLEASAYYQALDVNDTEQFTQLRTLVEQVERKGASRRGANRLVYCAVPNDLFEPITYNLVHSGLIRQDSGELPWHRIAYEKPFGYDTATAQALNKKLLSLLNESQLYRVDHFLAKEVVENITYTRFTNRVFESLWNKDNIESVQIVLDEEGGIGLRGAYYDAVGALSDVVQNHMLQLLALVAMDTPQQLTGNYIRDCKANILQHVRVEDGLLGQYNGYQQEAHVKPASTTETFVLLKLSIDDPRWHGVPFYIKTGKYLPKKETKIIIQFKQVACLLTKHCPVQGNRLIIDLFPNEGFSFALNVKKPMMRDEVVPVNMHFCYECLASTPEAYEHVLYDIIMGEQAVSVRVDEIESSWRIIDAVRAQQFPLAAYEQCSAGPQAAVAAFERKHGMRFI